MVANYEECGFRITAKNPPESCTGCPFWVTYSAYEEEGLRFIMGPISEDTKYDEERMSKCPIIIKKKK